LLGQIFEQSQSIANRCEQRRHCPADLLNHFSDELLLTGGINCAGFGHLSFQLSNGPRNARNDGLQGGALRR
jgi:hypothetical protein